MRLVCYRVIPFIGVPNSCIVFGDRGCCSFYHPQEQLVAKQLSVLFTSNAQSRRLTYFLQRVVSSLITRNCCATIRSRAGPLSITCINNVALKVARIRCPLLLNLYLTKSVYFHVMFASLLPRQSNNHFFLSQYK